MAQHSAGTAGGLLLPVLVLLVGAAVLVVVVDAKQDAGVVTEVTTDNYDAQVRSMLPREVKKEWEGRRGVRVGGFRLRSQRIRGHN